MLLDSYSAAPAAPRYPTLEAADQALEYRDIRSGADGPALVFLHEGLGCVSGWKDFPDRIATATRRRVFVYSRAGYGGSSPVALPRPLDYMAREGLDVLPAVLDAACIERCVLIGHSDGASIAIVHAGSASGARVEALVLLAPHVFTEKSGLGAIRAAREAYETGDLRRRLRRRHAGNVDNAFWGWCNAWLDPGFLAWSIEPYLAHIDVPILQIQGEDDAYGTTEQLHRIERGVAGPVITRVLSDCGHAPHRDQSDATLASIVSFLDDLY